MHGHRAEADAEFVWLVNNDAAVAPAVIAKTLDMLQQHTDCGALSPLILSNGRPIVSVEKVFSNNEIVNFQRRGATLSERMSGDQACFYFSKPMA